ncbi:hypothetical protein [Streptomyces ortus]|uniref:DUF3592 domain-containing protein n=1 Tax=Streptomyces ortus TaxID=2867268 RepID=A0ABT3VFH2_9ACTN|nr:hypothetical protein [Streptomyces ortus]MCX4238296.1 hypothetical protein [Streptomyces ortus]
MTPLRTEVPTEAPPVVRRARNRRQRIGAAAVGSVCALVAAWLLLVSTPAAISEGNAFRAAPRCASDGSGPGGGASGDCLRTVSARIDRTEDVRGRKTPSYHLYVVAADGTKGRARLGGSPTERPVASPGADVEVTYWRGRIRYVDLAAGRKYSHADPRDDYKVVASPGLAVGLYGTGFLWCWFWTALHSRAARRAHPWDLGVAFLAAVCLAVVGGLAPWVTDDMGAALLLVGLAVAVAVAVCVAIAVVLRLRRRGDDTIDVPPSVPTGEQHFPGRILGEVPYAERGTHLLAAAGRLATTMGHPGAAHRRAVPRTLTPLRVRHPYWSDASPTGLRGEAQVLECEDGGVPVLVVTGREHMPWVLGALTPRP